MMSDDSEILWEEQRGAIRLIAIKQKGVIRIEASATIYAIHAITEKEYQLIKYPIIGDIKRKLISQIAHACVELANDIRG